MNLKDIRAEETLQANSYYKKQNNEINICFSSDKKYAKFLALTIVSLLTNKNADDNLCIYILDGGLSQKDKQKIEELKKISDFTLNFINFDIEKFSCCPVHKNEHISLAAYYRLLISEFLPNLDKAVYLDCDIDIKTSLKELFETDINDFYFAAVLDVDSPKICKRLELDEYFNSGVLLLNLKKFRETNFCENIFKWIEQNKSILKLHDQDVLNLYCKGEIKKLDNKWNAQQKFHKNTQGAAVVHYVGRYKLDFMLNSTQYLSKTHYTKDIFLTFLRKLLEKMYKTFVYWIFRVRNKDKNTKEITIIGFKFIKKRNK